MAGAAKVSSDDIREYVRQEYVDVSRKKGVKRFTVNAGDVHRGLKLQNRVPLVCAALQSQKFARAHGLKLVEKSGPASGISTTLNLTFEFAHEISGEPDLFLQLQGIARDSFAKLGGGEKFLADERAAWETAPLRRRR